MSQGFEYITNRYKQSKIQAPRSVKLCQIKWRHFWNCLVDENITFLNKSNKSNNQTRWISFLICFFLQYFLHESSISWVWIRLHTKHQLPKYPGSGLQFCVGACVLRVWPPLHATYIHSWLLSSFYKLVTSVHLTLCFNFRILQGLGFDQAIIFFIFLTYSF